MSWRSFEVDKADAKLMGVCAGLGNMTGVDPTIVRIALVVATIVGGWPWTVIAYVALGIFGQPGRVRGRMQRRRQPASIAGTSYEDRDLDRRLAEIESYVASPNSRLAREIDELR
ncbi:MAG TPA: PspC domain-containing protein [Allosphingosinicella sp.]